MLIAPIDVVVTGSVLVTLKLDASVGKDGVVVIVVSADVLQAMLGLMKPLLQIQLMVWQSAVIWVFAIQVQAPASVAMGIQEKHVRE